MFDVGFAELMLLFVIGLLVLGPQRLPKVAAQIGKWIGRARRTANELRRQLEREIELAELAEKDQAKPATPAAPLSDAARSASDELAATANLMGGTPQDAAAASEAAVATVHAASPSEVVAPPNEIAPPPAVDTTSAPAVPEPAVPAHDSAEPPHGR